MGVLIFGQAGDIVHDMRSIESDGYLQALGNIQSLATSGSLMRIAKKTVTSAALSGATTNLTALIPAGAMVLGVLVRVLTTITGATSFTIGDGTTANKWGNNIALPAGTATTGADFLAAGVVKIYTAATDVVLTAVTSNFTGGVVKGVCYYIDWTAMTS